LFCYFILIDPRTFLYFSWRPRPLKINFRYLPLNRHYAFDFHFLPLEDLINYTKWYWHFFLSRSFGVMIRSPWVILMNRPSFSTCPQGWNSPALRRNSPDFQNILPLFLYHLLPFYWEYSWQLRGRLVSHLTFSQVILLGLPSLSSYSEEVRRIRNRGGIFSSHLFHGNEGGRKALYCHLSVLVFFDFSPI